jgi:hypothetical protein
MLDVLELQRQLVGMLVGLLDGMYLPFEDLSVDITLTGDGAKTCYAEIPLRF